MVGPQCLVGVGQFPKFANQYYAVQEGLDPATLGKLYLIPTAETPLANLHRDEILAERQLPIYYCAYTPCFRGEAGAAGVGTRGLIRVHQFDKVELIKIVKPEHGYAEQEKMLADAESILKTLGLHYRVALLCAGDMGFASAKTYDLEVWAPGQRSYLEGLECVQLRRFPGPPHESPLQGRNRRKPFSAPLERQRHGFGPPLRGAGGDLPASRWQPAHPRSAPGLSQG